MDLLTGNQGCRLLCVDLAFICRWIFRNHGSVRLGAQYKDGCCISTVRIPPFVSPRYLRLSVAIVGVLGRRHVHGLFCQHMTMRSDCTRRMSSSDTHQGSLDHFKSCLPSIDSEHVQNAPESMQHKEYDNQTYFSLRSGTQFGFKLEPRGPLKCLVVYTLPCSGYNWQMITANCLLPESRQHPRCGETRTNNRNTIVGLSRRRIWLPS
ncbi:hypothetical protein L226DRAFT_259862 [Lentinus tigrinus ALCF2SS1-7]|uniref:uncharacterized protein n=1 Tax=Lentinus tigrinus ALCF2SS1-7 TaxID=1328758 RepID=UPI0011662F39|nr:hypothetical protein L226DRAFT_259862 [Lentinus tigrinus ALCF2SS1-7]